MQILMHLKAGVTIAGMAYLTERVGQRPVWAVPGLQQQHCWVEKPALFGMQEQRSRMTVQQGYERCFNSCTAIYVLSKRFNVH